MTNEEDRLLQSRSSDSESNGYTVLEPNGKTACIHECTTPKSTKGLAYEANGFSPSYELEKKTHEHNVTLLKVSEGATEKIKPRGFSFRDLSGRKRMLMAVLIIGNCGHTLAYSLVAPFFPLEAQKKGLSPTSAGFVMGSYMLVSFCFAPVYGAYLTTIGVRFMFTAGICVGGTCAVLFGLLSHSPPGFAYFSLCFAVRFMEALGLTAYKTASVAVITSELRDHITTVQALLETTSSVGFALGPFFGFTLYKMGGFGLPFYVCGLFLVVLGAVTFSCLPSQIEVQNEERFSVLLLLRSAFIWIILLTIFLSAFSNGFVEVNISLHSVQFELPQDQLRWVFLVWSVVYLVLTPLFGWVNDRQDVPILTIATGCLIVSLSMMLFGPSLIFHFLPGKPWVLYLAIVIHSIGLIIAFVPTLKCLVMEVRYMGKEDSLSVFGVVAGLSQSVFSLGASMGPILGGILVEQTSVPDVSAMAAGMFILSAIVTTAFFNARRYFPRKKGLK